MNLVYFIIFLSIFICFTHFSRNDKKRIFNINKFNDNNTNINLYY